MTIQQVSAKIPWTEEEFATAWQMVPLDVKPLLRKLAERPEGYPLTELLEKEYDTFEPGKIRGMLSELNRIHKEKAFRRRPRLVHYDSDLTLIWMNTQVATLIGAQPNTLVLLSS